MSEANSLFIEGEMAMPVSIETLGIDKLSVRERLELIELIWDSIPTEVTLEEVPVNFLEELAKRRADAGTMPGVGKPHREALARFERNS